jgi:glycosyltransferase involved in cell wall biosynthesis
MTTLSIGLPVYNGERFLAGALGALLGQSFQDFELIIADNASTDRTVEIIQAFAASDRRVRLIRNDTNRGAARNYNLTLEQACGSYFKWAAHDDLCHPRFLERCVAVLDAEPETVLAHSRSSAIDENGRTIGQYDQETAFDTDRPAERFAAAILTPHLCISVFGVMRRELLLRTVRHGDWVGADRNLLAELALYGRVRLVPEVLFKRRAHAQASIHRFTDEHERLAWFDPAHRGRLSFPTWRRLQEYARAIQRAPLSSADRVACLRVLGRWLAGQHHTGPRNAHLLLSELVRPRRAG